MTATTPTPRRSKRSRIAPTMLLGAAAFALTACQDEEVKTSVFPDKAACEAAANAANSWLTIEECDAAYASAQAEHDKSAPRYNEQKLCEEQHGGQCYAQQSSGGSSLFMPLMMGYMMGNMMSGSSRVAPQPLYKTAAGKYATASGAAVLNSNRGTTSMTAANFKSGASTKTAAPMTRTSVNSTGGFGSSRTSFSSSSRSFGG